MRLVNAEVSVGQRVNQRTPFTVTLAQGTVSISLTVRRVATGVPIHVDMAITDRCGPWATFVGAGAQAP